MKRRLIWPFVLCLFVGLVAFLFLVTSPSSAHVRSVAVTNTNNSGPGSLRQAIADAEPGATIQFDLTYPATITLTSGELWIGTKDVTIAGPGPELLAISGNHAHRVLRVEARPPYDIHVAVSGLTIRDGYVTGGCHSGAGLFVGEGILSLTLTDVVFLGNAPDCYGGGMYHEGYQIDERNNDDGRDAMRHIAGGGGLVRTRDLGSAGGRGSRQYIPHSCQRLDHQFQADHNRHAPGDRSRRSGNRDCHHQHLVLH